MKLREETYADFSSSLTDEKSYAAFEEGGFSSDYELRFIICLFGPLFFLLYAISPLTLGLGAIAGAALMITIWVMNILILVGLTSVNEPMALLAWMPTEAPAADSGGDDVQE